MSVCPKCALEVDEKDNYCRRCGRALQPGTGFWYSHSGIILLAVVLGPFALIPVYLSKIISPTAKWIYTLLLALFTVYLGYVCWKIFLLMQEMMSSTLLLPY